MPRQLRLWLVLVGVERLVLFIEETGFGLN